MRRSYHPLSEVGALLLGWDLAGVTEVDLVVLAHHAELVARKGRPHEPWAREIELVDPDGNRLRIGTRH